MGYKLILFSVFSICMFIGQFGYSQTLVATNECSAVSTVFEAVRCKFRLALDSKSNPQIESLRAQLEANGLSGGTEISGAPVYVGGTISDGVYKMSYLATTDFSDGKTSKIIGVVVTVQTKNLLSPKISECEIEKVIGSSLGQ